MTERLLVERMVLGPFSTENAAEKAVKDWVKQSGESYYAHEVTQWKSGLWGASVYYFPEL